MKITAGFALGVTMLFVKIHTTLMIIIVPNIVLGIVCTLEDAPLHESGNLRISFARPETPPFTWLIIPLIEGSQV